MSDDLRVLFEELRRRYNRPRFIQSDPLRYVFRFEGNEDREVAAILGALFAYGRVQSIFNFLDELFSQMGPSPALTISGAGLRRPNGYRFQTSTDVQTLLHMLRDRIRDHGFPLFDRPAAHDVYEVIDGLMEDLWHSAPLQRRSRGLTFLIGRPGTSPAKRWCLFFRWMVRSEFPDTGLYTAIRAGQLIIPMDTHIMRIAQWTGLSPRKTADRRTAREITDGLRRFRPADPLAYDFSLTRPGILQDHTVLSRLAAFTRKAE